MQEFCPIQILIFYFDDLNIPYSLQHATATFMIMTTDGTTDPPNFNLVADISYGSISLVCFLVETDEESLGSKIPWVREVLWVTSEESLRG